MARFVPAILVVLAFVLQGAFAQDASALSGTPCLQTGLETVATDEPSYPAGATVHVTGTGYNLGCDVAVQITRPDSAIDAETVTTNVAGSFAYDYLIPGPPYATGTYLVDALGEGTILAHTSFEDAASVNQLFANGPSGSGTQTFVFTVGDTIYSNGTIDAGRNGRILITDGNGVNRFTSPCLPEATFEFSAGNPNGPPRYTFQASDPISTDNAHQWTYTVQQFAPADTACSGATQSTASRDFSFAKASVYLDPVLATLKTNFAAGQTAYVRVDGFETNRNGVDATWLLPAGATACANTSGSDRADSTTGGVLPDPADSSAPPPSTDAFHYPPRIQNVGADDPWNYNQSYDGYNAVSNPTPCPAFAGANQGTWKLKVQGNATHVTTLTVFVVDTTAPTVTIDQAAGQVDPTTGSPIHFTAVFSEAVTGFTGSDVSFAGSTSGGTKTATVTQIAPNNGTTYDVSVTGMSSRGTVVATIPAAGASDAAGNTSTASTSTDNSVTWDRVPATTAPVLSPATPQTNDNLTASTTTSDPDVDNVSVSWVWKVDRGGNVCLVQTNTSASAPAGVRSVSLNLSQNYAPSSCTGPMINPLNPSKGDVVRAEATPNEGLFDGATTSNTVTIANTAPTVTLSAGNDLSVAEGSTHTYSYSISDPDGDSIPSVATSCGANGTKSNDSHTDTSGSFDCSFPAGPASSTVSAQATDSGFGAAAGNTGSQSVTVNNVAPTVTLSALNDLSVAEGSTHTYSYSISDPGTDTVSSVTTSCGANGTKSNDTHTNTSGSFDCTFPDGPAGSTVSAAATDSDGGTGNTDSQSVTVNNVAPTVTLSALNGLSVAEGSTHTYSYTISDPGQDTVTSVTTSCSGTGSKVSGSDSFTNTSGSFQCAFADGPNSSTVSAAATDSDGGTGAADTQSVTVNNVAPTVTLSAGNDLSVAEGSTQGYSYSISDPGTDTVSSVTTSCGANGTKSNDTNTNTSGSFDCTFPDGPASSFVSAAATDSDGATSAAATQSVTVNNVAPTVTLTGPPNVDEGSTHTYTFSVVDPGVDTFSVATGYPQCGTGGNYVAGSLTTNTTGGSFQCTFPDGPATTELRIKVVDSDGASDADSEAVHVVEVGNVNPIVTAPANQSSDEGDAHSFALGSFSDPGPDGPWSVSVDWGDGSSATSFTSAAAGSLGSSVHTYADGPAIRTVTVTVTDANGGTGSASFQVGVDNVAPTVTLDSGNDLSVAEGSTHSYSYTISDPGTDTVSSVTTSCGANGTKSNDTNTNTSGSFDCTFPDGPAGSTVSASATDSDGDTGAADTQSVTVNNVAPVVALSAANDLSVNEGTDHIYSYTISDAGTDTVSAVTTSCGANGTKGIESHTDTSGSFHCTFPDGPAGSLVSASATDSDGATGNADTQTVTIDNVAPGTPSLVSPADGAVTNDETPTFDWSDVSDDGNDTVSYSLQVDNSGCGFASPEIDASGLTASEFTPATSMSAGTYCWRVRATDSDGANSGYSPTRTVTIDLTRPNVTIDQSSGQADPTSGSPIHFTAVFSEPVSGFTGTDVTIGGTAGGSKTVVVTDSGAQMTFDIAVSGMTDGTVVASIGANGAQDGAGNGNTASTSTDNSVLYDGTAPTLTVNQASGQSDPTSSSPIRFTAVFSEAVSGFQNGDVMIGGTAGGSKSASVTNPSNDGRTYDIAVLGMTTSGTVFVSVGANKAEDVAGNGNAASTSTDNTVTWVQQTQNTAPVVTITSPAFGSLYAKGTANVNLSASFTDPDAGQTHTCSINWDDGSITNPAVNETTRTCSQAHTFTSAGVYTIIVTICDNAGACGTAETWIVVYDPSAGFVTGGGWINVAPGSYPADPTLNGRANFGFNAKYQNGARPPSGQTEFNFQVANFNFHSETYEWLVVSGFKAQFRGTGSVNGVPGYDFRLTAYDGQVSGGGGLDKFRMKITRNGQTIFDNRMGIPDDPDVADPQVIAGGSVVIHR